MRTVEKKADLRVLRTRAALHEAFNELMEETTLDRITVKTLTERAGINRKTFYLHFETIEAFYDSIMNGIMDDFFENYETTADDPYDIDGHARRFFLFLASQPSIVERLICAPGLYDFGERIYRTQMNRYKSVGNPFDWMPIRSGRAGEELHPQYRPGLLPPMGTRGQDSVRGHRCPAAE